MPQRRFSFDWLTRGTPWIVKVVRKPLGSLDRFSAPLLPNTQFPLNPDLVPTARDHRQTAASLFQSGPNDLNFPNRLAPGFPTPRPPPAYTGLKTTQRQTTTLTKFTPCLAALTIYLNQGRDLLRARASLGGGRVPQWQPMGPIALNRHRWGPRA